jgi:thiol-disulfide isomerase/thioredoxin
LRGTVGGRRRCCLVHAPLSLPDVFHRRLCRRVAPVRNLVQPRRKETRFVKSSVPTHTRTWLLVAVLGALIISWALFHRQINRILGVRLFLNSNSPREELFNELAAQGNDPVNFLQLCWATGKIPQRQFVAAFLKDQAVANSPWLSRAEPLVLACTADADLSVRELGFAALEAMHAPRMFEASLAQLSDLDPSARELGLAYLRKCAPKQAVPVLIRLLQDPDLQIVTGAEVGLRRWSGEDYGVRMHLAIPTPEEVQSGQIDSNKMEAIHQGVEKRREWWRLHEKEYPIAPASEAESANNPTAKVPRLPATDFTLRDLDGNSVSLSDFRGKVVLLNFWATWCTACLAEIPALVALQQKLGNQVAILGIALDGVADEHGDIPGDEGDDKSHKDGPSLKAIHAKVERSVKLRGINYRILLDPKNVVGSQYNGGELPTTVIFDKEGRVRRRFLGERSLAVFEAMIAEAGKPLDASKGQTGQTSQR